MNTFVLTCGNQYVVADIVDYNTPKCKMPIFTDLTNNLQEATLFDKSTKFPPISQFGMHRKSAKKDEKNNKIILENEK